VDCLKEVISRRFKRTHHAWPKPNLILVDGGKAQVNAVKSTLIFDIPIVGIAKGKTRKKNEFIFDKTNKKLSALVNKNSQLLIKVRNEAHRFAIGYQKKLRKIE
jgi:excinuclease ABC subunit C